MHKRLNQIQNVSQTRNPENIYYMVTERVKNYHNKMYINPLTDGLQIKAVLMGGGIECPPSKILENESTESCEGSKKGFLGMPSSSRLFSVG